MTRHLAAKETAGIRYAPAASVPLRTLTASLVALFALDNVLLLRLLGGSPALVTALALIVPPLLAGIAYRFMPGACRIGLSTILFCLAVAAILLLLGGEGRLFFAPADWQVRDAVLADMGTHRWPFDYWLDGHSQLLRAPVGMYLLPALWGGASQVGRDWTLFAHNCLFLGLLLAQGSALFDTRRSRLIALAVFVAFSGLDVVGNLLVQLTNGEARWDHIEDWADGYQYSAHITQIFWVPQHAIAGWAVALTYLLWQRKLAPVGLFAATLPLVALWSPLILFGALPFALFAGLRALWTKGWSWRDVALPAIATLVAIPALAYLSSGATAIGGGLRPPKAIVYVLLMLFEVIPFLLPLLRDPDNRVDKPTILISGACLFLMPSWSMGMFNDFQTRASIMPLALMAVAFGDWAGRIDDRRTRLCFLTILLLGAVTGGIGIANALRLPPSPVPHCSVAGVWDRQTNLSAPHNAYFADRAAFPFPIHPVDHVSRVNPATCWDRPWPAAIATAEARQARP
ncbi:hypothetical protein [Sphingobium estronivorans]|uniref:hypothetical protein n=1 Tax=Sphingobium estronivorans TaxID=1577690 RepID=UPI00123B49E4|nr:hypothetical protein [Sphingobium estronivorans]